MEDSRGKQRIYGAEEIRRQKCM